MCFKVVITLSISRLFLLGFISALHAVAQSNGSIAGQVTDLSEAAVPGTQRLVKILFAAKAAGTFAELPDAAKRKAAKSIELLQLHP